MAIITTDDKHYKELAEEIRSIGRDVFPDSPPSQKLKPSEMAAQLKIWNEKKNEKIAELEAILDRAIVVDKSITKNGTYNAEDEAAWGYSTVYVEVPTFENENRILEEKVANLEQEVSQKNTEIAELEQEVTEAKDAGIEEERTRFWGIYQDYGNRTNYGFAYAGAGWRQSTFQPQYDMNIASANYMFHLSQVTDIKNLNCVLDFSNCTTFTYAFSQSAIETMGIIDTRSCGNLAYTFYSCYGLRSIDKIILGNSGSQAFATTTFNGCFELRDVVFEGVIGANSFNLQWSTKLSKDSITSVVNALSTTTSGLTVTLSKVAVNAAFETSEGANDGVSSAEWATLIATRTNWTISLV